MYISTFALVCIVACFFWYSSRKEKELTIVRDALRTARYRIEELEEWHKTEEGRADRAREGFRHISNTLFNERDSIESDDVKERLNDAVEAARDFMRDDEANAYKDAPWDQR
ncbi:hypothetical protein ACEOHC_003862 [Salmonella enterica]